MPNPAKNEIALSIPGAWALDESLEILISNISGNTINALPKKTSSSTYLLNVSALESGIYFITVKTNKNLEVNKVIVSH